MSRPPLDVGNFLMLSERGSVEPLSKLASDGSSDGSLITTLSSPVDVSTHSDAGAPDAIVCMDAPWDNTRRESLG